MRKHPEGNHQFWESAALNDRTFIQYYNRLTELSVSMFEWKNIPDTIDPRFLELALFARGSAVFFRDEVLGYLCLRVMIGGEWDVYNVPKYRTAFATNGYQAQLDYTNSVIIYNNMLRTPSMLDVEMFSKRLYNMDRIIDVNVNAQKTPLLITCDENERLTMKNLFKKYDGNEPVIFGSKNLKPDSIKVVKTDAPFISKQIMDLKTQIWNEALTYLGISNTNIQKRERMISDEVLRNQGGVIASRYSRLNARKQACKQINEMFGLNIDCDYREDYSELADNIIDMEEGAADE